MCFCILGFLASAAQAQTNQGMQALVLDSLSLEPLEGASLMVHKHKHAHLSNAKGIATIDSLPEGTLVIHVSYVGYHHKDVVLNAPPKGVVRILLCPENIYLHESLISESGGGKGVSGRQKELLSAEELNRRSGQNLAELLKSINGVTSLNSSGGIAKPVVRGLTGQRLVTMQGNARIEGQQWADDHGPELDPFQSGGIELIKGAAALEFGPEAIGGVIRSLPQSWRKEQGMGGAFSMQGFSNNRQGAAFVQLEQRIGKEKFFAWRLQTSGRRAGDAHAPDYVLSNTGFAENAQGIQLIRSTPKWVWEAGISRFNSKQAILAASHMGNIKDLEQALQSEVPMVILPFTYQINKPYQQVNHVLLQSTFTYHLNTGSLLKLVYVQQVNRRQEFDADRIYNPNLQGKPAMDLEIQSFVGEQYYEKRFAWHWKLKAGVSETYQYNTIAGLQFIIPPFKAFTLGGFLILKKETQHGDISLGLRADRRLLDVPEYKRNGKTFSDRRLFTGPSAGITYNLNLPKQTLLSATLQSGWRPPSVNELYSYGLHYGLATFEMGDSSLSPERSYLIDLNLRKVYMNWYADMSVFAEQYRGYIYKAPLADPILTIRGAFPAFQYAQANVNRIGAEFSLNRKVTQGICWQSRFSYLYAQNTSLDQPLFGMPANRMAHYLGYAFKNRKRIEKPFIELQSEWVAMQKRYVTGEDYRNPPPAYVLFNLQASFAWHAFANKESMGVSISIMNLLNQNYRDYQSRFRYFANDPGINLIIRIYQKF